MKNLLRSFLTFSILATSLVSIVSCGKINSSKPTEYFTNVVKHAQDYYEVYKPKSWAFFTGRTFKEDKWDIHDLLDRLYEKGAKYNHAKFSVLDKVWLELFTCNIKKFDESAQTRQCYYIAENLYNGITLKDDQIITLDQEQYKDFIFDFYHNNVNKHPEYQKLESWSKQDWYKIEI